MKHFFAGGSGLMALGVCLGVWGSGSLLWAQGSLEPPSGPTPGMKSLEEIWQKLETLESENGALSQELATQKAQTQGMSALLLYMATEQGITLPWNVQTVDAAANDVGRYCSLAFGPSGEPAIAYYDATAQTLKFARFENGAWSVEVVDATSDAGRNCSLAYSPAGEPWITYEGINQTLMVAHRNSTAWVLDAVSGAGAGTDPEIKFGPDGLPAVVFIEGGTDVALGLADESGNWNVERLEVNMLPTNPVVTPAYPTLAYSPRTERWRIAYQDVERGWLRGASRDATGTYSYQSLDAPAPPATAGAYASMAMGQDGFPTIFSYDGVGGNLRYRQERVDSSTTDAAVVSNDVGKGVSAVYSPAGLPSASFFDESQDDLKFVRQRGSDTSWAVVVVDSAGSVGRYSSLAYGPSGLPAIAYYDETNGNLKIAIMGGGLLP